MKKIVLIDGFSILNRAYYGIPLMTSKSGIHTNGIYGFFNIVIRILEEEKPSHLVIAFDTGKPTFRHEMYEAYKGTRSKMPDELCEQIPVLEEIIHSMNICLLKKVGYEADDILGTIAKLSEKEGFEVSLVSGDRDLLQISSEKIKIRIPKTTKGGSQIFDYYPNDVVAEYGITPLQVIDLKGLMGDSSDNIPGVPGVGQKTAVSLLQQYGSVEGVYENVEQVKGKLKEKLSDNKESAFKSKILATIKTDCELDYSSKDSALAEENYRSIFTREAGNKFADLQMYSLLKYFSKKADRKFNIIGVTGGIGCGKSKVIDIIGRLYKGKTVYLHCDEMCKQLYLPGSPVYSQIRDSFGDDYFDEFGMLIKEKFSALIYESKEALLKIEQITHPVVISQIKEKIEECKTNGFDGIVIIESALLFRAGIDKICDSTWNISSPDELRRERLVEKRHYSNEKIDEIINNQKENEADYQKCDVVIVNGYKGDDKLENDSAENVQLSLFDLFVSEKEKMDDIDLERQIKKAFSALRIYY